MISRFRREAALVLFFILGESAAALPISLEASETSAAAVRLVLTSENAGQEPRGFEVALPWQGDLPLPAGEKINLSAQASGFWPCEAWVPTDQEAVRWKLVRQSTIRGRLKVPAATEPVPASVQLRIESSQAAENSKAAIVACDRATVEVSCPVAADLHFECPAPVGVLAVRAAVANYIPFYFWDLKHTPAGQLDLGTLELHRGASVVGFLTGQGVELSKAQVRAERQGFGATSNEDRARLARMEAKAQANERGFFQLAGLAPGLFQITATAGEQISAAIEVSVKEGEELALGASLELQPPFEASFVIEPPASPFGEPWRLVLQRKMGGSFLDVAEKEVSLQGQSTIGLLRPDHYRLELQDTKGSVWHREAFELSASRSFFIALDLVEIRGRLLVGTEGREGTVVFGANQVPRIALASDAAGNFEGFLPHEGEWPLLVEWPSTERRKLPPVEVRRSTGKGWVELDVVLPDTLLRGQVTRQGKLVDASVVLRAQNTAKLSSSVLTRKGQFEMAGLENGRYEIAAFDRGDQSPWQEVEIAEKLPSPRIQLEFQPSRQARGIVRHGGQSVPGASVVARSPLDTMGWDGMLKATSALDGGFNLPLPEGASVVDLLVQAPGLPIWMGRLRLGGETTPAIIELAGQGGELAFPVNEPAEWSLRYDGVEIGLASLLQALVRTHGGYLQREGDYAYRAPNLPIGEWTLCRIAAPGDCATTYLLPGTAVDLAPAKY